MCYAVTRLRGYAYVIVCLNTPYENTKIVKKNIALIFNQQGFSTFWMGEPNLDTFFLF